MSISFELPRSYLDQPSAAYPQSYLDQLSSGYPLGFEDLASAAHQLGGLPGDPSSNSPLFQINGPQPELGVSFDRMLGRRRKEPCLPGIVEEDSIPSSPPMDILL